MISSIISRLVILIFGTLYPVYASYKAVRSKDVKGYVQWMMYWIVFGLFTCTETITDIFLSWFPFYYEIKIIVVFWLLSPATKGSSILYRKFVHPMLSNREQEIDECLSKAKQQTYRQVLDLGSKGVTVLMQTALKGGGGLVNQLRKSYSLSDLSDPAHDEARDDVDVAITDPRLLRKKRGRSPLRSSSTNSAIYFSEIDVRTDRIANVKSIEDISSGYSSGEGLQAGLPLKVQSREGVHRTGSLTRSRTTRVTRTSVSSGTAKKPSSAPNSDESDENEIFDTNIIFLNDRAKNINKLTLAKSQTSYAPPSSDSETEFFDTTESSKFLPHGDKHSKHITTTVIIDKEPLVSCSNDNNNCITNNACENRQIHTDLDNLTKTLPLLLPKSTEILNLSADENEENKKTKNNSNDVRGGKYNKKMAPPPPKLDNNPIKAKLVLQPGIVRNLSSNSVEESGKNEIFLRHSPKLHRRRSIRSKSPSPSNSMSHKIRLDMFSKMLHKIPAQISNKRHSWQDFFNAKSKEKLNTLSLLNGLSNRLSKSENVLNKKDTKETKENKDKENISLKRSSSQMSIKLLKESPLATRRLKIIRTYVDQDID